MFLPPTHLYLSNHPTTSSASYLHPLLRIQDFGIPETGGKVDGEKERQERIKDDVKCGPGPCLPQAPVEEIERGR